MIARHEAQSERDVWSQLATPIAEQAISWRQDGRPVLRDGKYFARYVAYIDANTVRERLDGIVPGEWDLTLELLPHVPSPDDPADSVCSFKARLQILGVIREDVGTGRDYKAAATDAFKRAAVRFGIGHELYGFEPNWVRVESDEKHANPLEDPASSFVRRSRPQRPLPSELESSSDTGARVTASESDSVEPVCPKCGGRVWDNRLSKRNPKAPDFKCRDRSCDGVIWPTRASANGSGRYSDHSATATLTATVPNAGPTPDLPF